MRQIKLELERLKELLFYSPENGQFTWRVSRGRLAKAGATAGDYDMADIAVFLLMVLGIRLIVWRGSTYTGSGHQVKSIT